MAPSLIPFLGDAATVGGTSFQALAAASLKRLDLGALADAVLTGLSGDTSRLRDAVADHRDEVVEAFVTALAGPRAIQAVAAIVELRAVETLPTLLAVRAGARSDHALGRALDAAIRELEALGSLPRPADASDARPGTLPRAVDEGA